MYSHNSGSLNCMRLGGEIPGDLLTLKPQEFSMPKKGL